MRNFNLNIVLVRFFLILVILNLGLVSIVFSATRTSIATGNWNNSGTWDCGCTPSSTDDVIIVSGTTVTVNADYTIANVTINSGGVISHSNGANRTLTITGNYTNNGSHTGGNNADAKGLLTGTGTTINGLGSISTNSGLEVSTGNKTISNTANLTFASAFTITGAITVTNNGIITITSGFNIVGSAAGSTWTNATNSTLKVGGVLLSTGTLNTSASGNTVEYFYEAAQNIKTPSGGDYFHLTVSSASTKSLQGTLIINGNLNISGGTLDVNGNDFSLLGNWSNSGTFTTGTRTVTLTGTSAQTITNTAGQTFYNLTINKSSQTITLNNDVIASNNLTMTAGNLVTGSNKITLGTGTGNEGTLSYTAGTIVGNFERWIASTTTATNIVFPVGTSSNLRNAVANFNTITTGGSLIVQFIATAPGNNGLSLVDGAVTVYNTFVEGYWDFTTANSFASSNFNLELTGTGFVSFSVTAVTRLLTRANSGSAWTANGTHVNASGSTSYRNNVTQLSGQFSFGDDTNCAGPSTSAITGAAEVCASVTGEAYSVTDTPGSTYTWIITGGTQMSGGTGSSITVDWGASGMIGTVEVVENNGCTDGATISQSVTIHALAETSITGKLNVAEVTTGEPYSVTNTAGYTYTWNITGGTQASGTTTNSITVDWGAAGTGVVEVIANNTACGNSSTAYSINVNLYIVVNSIATGVWDDATTWDCNCVPSSTNSARIKNPHTVTYPNSAAYSITHLVIDVGGTASNTSSRIFTVSGDITVNGTFSGTQQLTLSGGATSTITGTGTISTSGNVVISNGNKTTTTTTVLNRTSGATTINSGITVTNNGTISFTGSVDGGNAASTWINATNSTLNIGSTFLTTGTLTATASQNTVNYNASGAQGIKDPSISTYYNLSTAGTSAKTLPNNLTITGGITMDGTSSIDVGSGLNYGLTVAGNWNNNSGVNAFVGRSGTVTFNGSTTLGGTSATSFNNITITGTLTGLAAGNFNLTGTWTNNGTFTHNSGTATFNGSTAAQSLAGSNSTTFNNLTISNTNSQVTLGIGITANGTITMSNGNLDMNGFNINLGTTGTVSGETNTKRILGSTGEIQLTKTLSVLTAYTNIAGLGIDITTAATAPGATTIYRGHAAQTGSGNSSIHRYFTITPTTNSGLLATLRIYYFDNELNTQTSDINMSLYKASSPFTTWTTMNGTWTDAADDYVELAAIDGFSRWTVSNKNNNPLPIELVKFDAEVISAHEVDLHWTTSSEINNDYFTIEKTDNGREFEFVAEVNGAGNCNQTRNYLAVDTHPSIGISYYRLKQTDYDGKYSFSNLVPVEVKTSSNMSVAHVYPNPVKSGELVSIQLNHDQFGPHVVQLMDMFGQTKFSSVEFKTTKGNLTFPLTQEMSSGIYTITIEGGDHKYYSKLVIE